MVIARDETDVGDAEHIAQLARREPSSGPGLGAAPGAGCGKAVDIAVWNVMLPSTFCMIWWMWPLSTVTEPKRFSIAERLLAVLRCPSPTAGRPPRAGCGANTTMGVLVGEPRQVVLEPVELRSAPSLPRPFELHDVDQADEVHAVVIEAVPAVALGALAEALEIFLAVVDR